MKKILMGKNGIFVKREKKTNSQYKEVKYFVPSLKVDPALYVVLFTFYSYIPIGVYETIKRVGYEIPEEITKSLDITSYILLVSTVLYKVVIFYIFFLFIIHILNQYQPTKGKMIIGLIFCAIPIESLLDASFNSFWISSIATVLILGLTIKYITIKKSEYKNLILAIYITMLVGIISFGQAFSTLINRDEYLIITIEKKQYVLIDTISKDKGFFVGYNDKENKKTNQYKIINLNKDLTFTKKKIE